MPTTANLYIGNVRLGNPDSQWDVLTAATGGTTVDLSWPAAGGSPSSYEISVDGVVQDVGNVTSYSVTGLTIATNYEFKVRPVYASGPPGGWSFFKVAQAAGWNAATGGTEATIANYNGSGETWKTHTFTSDSTLNVSFASAAFPFRVLVVGGGGGGSTANGGMSEHCLGAGGAGGMIVDTNASISVGAHAITIGSGGGIRAAGGDTTLGSIYTAIGGGAGPFAGTGGTGGSGGGGSGYGGTAGGGAGTPGQGNSGGIGYVGGHGGGGGGAGGAGGNVSAGAGLADDITGSSVTYATGGGAHGGTPATANSGNGGNYGGSGSSGIVVVAYRIA